MRKRGGPSITRFARLRKRSVTRLEELLTLRWELAHLAGFESYAGHDPARSDDGQVAGVGAAVLAGPVEEERAQGSARDGRPPPGKETASGASFGGDCKPGTRTFASPASGRRRGSRTKSDSLSSYFSLGTVMQGPLSTLYALVRSPVRAQRDDEGRDMASGCEAARRRFGHGWPRRRPLLRSLLQR